MHSVLYIGSDEFSANVLREIVALGKVKILAVATYCDIQHGRGHHSIPTPIKGEARRLNLPVIEIPDVDDPQVHRELAELGVPLAIMVSFKFVPVEFIRAFPKGIINLHPSLLPDLRGAAPVQWAIMYGYSESGLTTFLLSEKLDAGDILLQEKFSIGDNETFGELLCRITQPGASLLSESVVGYLTGKITCVPQKGKPQNLAPKIQFVHRIIQWEWDARMIHNRIRGLSPYPTAIVKLGEKVIKIIKARLVDTETKGEPGTIANVAGGEIWVHTGKGLIALLELQPEGRKKMFAREFAKGYIREKGMKFTVVEESTDNE